MSDYYPFTGPLTPSDASAVIVADSQGRVLMQLRDDRPGIFYPNRWGLPGGALEEGESFLDGALRELVEETGIDGTGKLIEFCQLELDFKPLGFGFVKRVIYEFAEAPVTIEVCAPTEGQKMEFIDPVPVMRSGQVVPYDEFCLWMFKNRVAKESAI